MQSSIIKVVKVNRHVYSITDIDLDILEVIINELKEKNDSDRFSYIFTSLPGLARKFHNPLTKYLYTDKTDYNTTMEPVLARLIISSEIYIPVIYLRGKRINDKITVNSDSLIYARPSKRIMAYDNSFNNISISSEEPIIISGFIVFPNKVNSAVISIEEWNKFNFIGVNNSSSLFRSVTSNILPLISNAKLSTESPVKGAIYFSLKDQKTVILRSIDVYLRKIINYFYTGAAAIISSQSVVNKKIKPKISKLVVKTAPKLLVREKFADNILENLVKKLMSIQNIDSQGKYYEMQYIFELFNYNILDTYLLALINGINSPEINNYFDLIVKSRDKIQKTHDINYKLVQSNNLANMYMIIIENKFGEARTIKLLEDLRKNLSVMAINVPGGYIADIRDMINPTDPIPILAALTSQEVKLVLLEYENRLKRIGASINNKCSHIVKYQQLMKSINRTQSDKNLTELMEYFKEIPKCKHDSQCEFIYCKLCNYQIMCPHLYDKILLNNKLASFDEIKSRMFSYIHNHTTSVGLQSSNYYCKVCSENIGNLDSEGFVIPKINDFGSEVRTKIWSTAILACRNLKFSTVMNEHSFANNASNTIFNIIGVSKDNNITTYLELDIIIYVYAYILHVINGDSSIGFMNVKPGSKLTIYATGIVNYILKSHSGLIAEMKDIEISAINAKLIESYHKIGSLYKNTIGNSIARPEVEIMKQLPIFSTIYNYSSSVARYVNDLKFGPVSTPEEAKKEFELIMGRTSLEIINHAKNNMKNPIYLAVYTRSTGIEVPIETSYEFMVKNPEVNIFSRIYTIPDKSIYQDKVDSYYKLLKNAVPILGGKPANKKVSSKQIANKVIHNSKNDTNKNNIQKNPISKINNNTLVKNMDEITGQYIESYRLFTNYTKKLYNFSEVEKYQEEFSKYKKCEEILERSKKKRLTYNYFHNTSKYRYKYKDIPITALYDEEGLAHDWVKNVSYIYNTGEIPGGSKHAMEARKTGKLPYNSVLLDLKCPICGIMASKIYKLNVQKTMESIDVNSRIGSFFKFYESRCPAGGLHEWDNDKSCKKCKLLASTFDSTSELLSKASKDYYIENLNKFNDARRYIISKTQDTNKETKNITTLNEKIVSKVKSWNYDYTLAVKIAELVKVSPNVIESLGSMEGREYKDIVEGINVPIPPTEKSDARILAVDAEIRSLLSNYSTLRNYSRLSAEETPIIRRIVEIINISGSYEFDKLPLIGSDYIDEFRIAYENLESEILFKFLQQKLCEYVFEIYKIDTEICKKFAVQEFNIILKSQRMFAKPGAFNWGLFETEIDMGDEDEFELDGGPDPSMITGEQMDYDTSDRNPNNEPS